MEEIRSPSNSLIKDNRVELKNALINNCLVRDYFKCPINTRIRDVGVTLLAQAMLSDAVQYFVDISLPECLLAKSAFLPSTLIEMVVTKEKFGLDFSAKKTKRIIYTRSTAALVELQAIQHCQQVNLFVLSDCKKESQFIDAIADFLNSDASVDCMLIVIELSKTPPSMINFVRNKLESVDSPGKGFTMMIHGANVDIRSHCIYDVVFDRNWEQKFIDSFSDTCDLSWLQIAYTLDIFDTSIVSSTLRKQCDAYFPLAVELISEMLPISGKAGSEPKFKGSVDIFLREKLLNLYSDFWLKIEFNCDDSGTPASYAILREEIRSIVQKYATNAFNISLLQYVSNEMNNLFTRFIFYYIEAIFEDISVADFIETSSLDGRLTNLLIEGLDFLPQPDLGILDTPIHFNAIHSLQEQEKSFPFFRRLHRFMQDRVREAVEVHCEGEISEDVWIAMVTHFSRSIEPQPDLFGAKLYVLVENSSVWKFYLEKFVSVKFPSANSLQSRFISFWLDRHICFIPQKLDLSSNIALLYLTCAINKYNDLLQSFFHCLGQFQFSTTEESIQRYLDCCNEESSSSTIITQEFINICYEAMLGCNSCEDYLSWTRSVNSLLLKPVGELRKCDRLLKKMTAVITVSSLLTEKQWDVTKLSDFRQILHIDDSELLFSMIVRHFQISISTDIDLDFITLLVRNIGERLSEEDKIWIIDKIFVDSVIKSAIQWAPLLDILLFGIMDDFTVERSSSFPASMAEWVKLVHDSSLLFTRVESQINNAVYIPDFLREPGDTSQFPLLADVAFYIIWKWIHTFSASNASIIEMYALKNNLYKSLPRDVKKTIFDAAYDLLIIKRWVESILNQDGSCEETQRIVTDIVNNCTPQKNWISCTRRLFVELCESKDLESLSKSIKKWRTERCGRNKILRSWLKSCEILDYVKFEDFSFQSCLKISRSSHSNEDPITIAASRSIVSMSPAADDPINVGDSSSNSSAIPCVGGLDRLTYIWVLQYIWNFYQWLTGEMMNNDVTAEYAQQRLIGQVIGESDPEYKILWVKLKVGIRQYIKSGRMKDFGKDIEETSIWELLSVCDHNGTRNGILVDIMAAILQDCKRALFGLFYADSTSETVTLKWQHLESIEKLLSFSPELIDKDFFDDDIENYEKYLEERINGCTQVLGRFGIWQRLMWISETRQNPILLNLESQRVHNIIPDLLNLRIKPIVCTFSGSGLDMPSLSESTFDPIFHSSEKLEIRSLLRSLIYFESTDNGDASRSFQEVVETVYGSSSLDLPKIFGISDSNQLAFLSSLQFKEVPKLIGYLEALLKSEKFLFSNKPLELKNSWSASVDTRLNDLRRTDLAFCEEARRLEALLIEHEVVLSNNCKTSLTSVLARSVQSEDDLLAQYPLLREVLAVFSSDNSCSLICGHYMFLRLKLRYWINSYKKAAPDRTWDWSIKSYHANTLDGPFEPIIRPYKVPWFERAVTSVVNRPDGDTNGWSHIEPLSNESNNSCSPGLTTFLNKSLSTSASSSPGSTFFPNKSLSSSASKSGKINDHKILLKQLEFELKTPKMKLSFVNKLKNIVGDKLFRAPDKQQNELYCKANEYIKAYSDRVDEYSKNLAALLAEKPFNYVEVQAACDKLIELEATNDAHYQTACDYLDRFENLFSRQRDILHWKTSSVSVMKKLEEEAAFLGVDLNPELLRLKIVLEKDMQILEHGLTAWALDTKVIKTLMRACEHFPDISDPFLLESTTTVEQRDHISNNGYIDKIKTGDDDGTLAELFEKLLKDVQSDPFYSWVHSKAVVAVVAVMPSQLKFHRYKVWGYLKNYLQTVIEQPKREVANIIMLVLARIDPNCDPHFRRACLRKLYSAKSAVWMTEAEIECLQSPLEEVGTDSGELKTTAVHSPSISKLIDLVGQDKIKAKIEELSNRYSGPEYSVTQSHHFILMGNPGTGKTSVAKIIYEFLVEAGIRFSPFIELSGDAILRMGFDQFSAEIMKAENGVLFIDDAHALSPTSTLDGPAIIELILDFAESKRHNTSIIVAGNKNGIEDNLLNFHSGFASRFPHIFTFDDYTDEELGSIFRHMCKKRQWSCFNEDVVSAAVRQISRHRGRKDFCNARSVRDFFEATYRNTVCARKNHSQTFILADVLGPNPDPKSNFDLKTALDELNKMVGLKAAKDEIHHLIDKVSANYDLLLRGEISLPTFRLNRVFLGNPGTGKTTVAKLYGQILKDLGLLSDGGIELQHSKDLIGASVDESHMKIAALLERCAGKVIIIDEAIDLFESPYGSEAVKAMVGMLHHTVPEDVAIVLIGYNMHMCDKLRAINEGLVWRFWLDRPFVFEDYTDDELRHIAADFAARKNLRTNFSAQEALIRSVSGNAGTMADLINYAIASLTNRDPSSKVLTLEDFGLSVNQPDIHRILLAACLGAGYDSSHEKRMELTMILAQVESGGLYPADIMTLLESKCGTSVHSIMPLLRAHSLTLWKGMKNAVTAEEMSLQERKRLLESGRQDECLQLDLDRRQQVDTLTSNKFCAEGFSWHRKGDGWLCAGGTCFVSDERVEELS